MNVNLFSGIGEVSFVRMFCNILENYPIIKEEFFSYLEEKFEWDIGKGEIETEVVLKNVKIQDLIL